MTGLSFCNLDLTWNLLNLVSGAVMHGDGNNNPDESSLTYAWLSDGTKVSARTDDGSGNRVQKRYLGSFVYTSIGGSSTEPPVEIESIAWDEGRIFYNLAEVEDLVEEANTPVGEEEVVDSLAVVDSVAVAGWFRDCWFAGDHLGNVRSVIDITSDLVAPQILEQNDYLPFGTKIQNPDLTCWMDNRWQYAGKEAQRFAPGGVFNQPSLSGSGSVDLGLLNFGARMYDPFAVRWISTDRMAIAYSPLSPYLFCVGSPLRYKDPYGLWTEDQANGFLLAEIGDNARSLAQYLNLPVREARRLLLDQGLIPGNLQEGDLFNPGGISGTISVSVCTVNDGDINAAEGNHALGVATALSSATGEGLKNTKATFRLYNSFGDWDPTFYKNGWIANQYVRATRLSSFAPLLKKAGTIGTVIGLGAQLKKIQDASTEEERTWAIIDAVVSATSFLPYGQAIAIPWALGGGSLVRKNAEWNTKLINEGYNPGSIEYQPFK